ncbi:AbrB/MazE/SpoVT family DNA-binding domain-containing protein [Hydrogenoanaerobacterium saccharovorans]|uniref:AbrB/MazE/SpoVT family DNA-binding domain-containing protein n=1 Tax=Hydrogenoanaerobacterium saccharovorans TaxID=474960 RepID=A0ABS2GMC2_9FIRM|nr:stage V sporulation T C-terminal domain-containing protein [Hydrogenoanaerobacterium saccharovorans]MBM6923228.1 AbrB/MazE/SpoVT family DNA-binding domain-containing protein [Hydrogenoanaerobacterium saccharovorans]
MKATGIVRRIDDLGRVVIPKEIRRTMRIREGDPLEIFTNNDGEVIFKKYSPLGELGEFAGVYAEVLGKVLTTPVLICDRDHVIAAAGLPKKEVLERRAAPALEEIMESRQSYILENPQSSPVYAVEGYDRPAVAVYPILAAGDVCGAVILSAGEDRRQPSEADRKLIAAAAMFLGRQMEE